MSVTTKEHMKSRRVRNDPRNPGGTLTYWVRGTASETTALAAAQADIPTTFGGLPRKSIDLEYQGGQLWTAEADFGALDYAQATQGGGQGDPSPDGNLGAEGSFSTGGGT